MLNILLTLLDEYVFTLRTATVPMLSRQYNGVLVKHEIL